MKTQTLDITGGNDRQVNQPINQPINQSINQVNRGSQPSPQPLNPPTAHISHSPAQHLHQTLHTQQTPRRKRPVPRNLHKHPLIPHNLPQHVLQTPLHQHRKRRRRRRFSVRHFARISLQQGQKRRVLPSWQFVAAGRSDQEVEQRDVDGEGLVGGLEVGDLWGGFGGGG